MKNPKQTIVLLNGNIVTNSANQSEPLKGSIVIQSGKIQYISSEPPNLNKLDQPLIIDAAGCWITPSFVDLCHYIREPGFEHKGTILSETKAAAAAGFTHLISPPTTSPVIDNPAVAKMVQSLAATSGYCTILPLGAMTKGLNNEQLSEMNALKEAGCIGIYAGDPLTTDTQTLLRCLEYAGTFDLPIYFRPSDASLSAGGLMHEGEISNRLGIPGIPAFAESIALAQYLQIVEVTGVTAHFSRITCARSVQLIADAKQKGLKVSSDVSLQHLLYTDASLEEFDSRYLDNPPFRSEPHRQALIAGLTNGTIDAICSNHQPHEKSAKMAPLGDCEKGLATLDTFIPNLIALTEHSSLTLPMLIKKLTIEPVGLLRKQIDRKLDMLPFGTLEIEQSANIAVINPLKKWSAEAQYLHSFGDNNAQLNQAMTGKNIATIANGLLIFKDEQ